MTPMREVARSKATGSNSNTCASPSSNVTLRSARSATRCRATSSIGSEMSTATTRPCSPTDAASGTVNAPVPQPISSTLLPPAMPKRASNNSVLSRLRDKLPYAGLGFVANGIEKNALKALIVKSK
jgi:hypothetical protein